MAAPAGRHTGGGPRTLGRSIPRYRSRSRSLPDAFWYPRHGLSSRPPPKIVDLLTLLRRSVPLLLCLATSHNVDAFDQDPTITDFLHTGWAVADGAPSGVHALAQTADGYLWMASTTGLFRFDGVRFERYQPPQGGDLQFRNVSALLPTPDGGLWIGRAGGATFLRSGQAVSYGRGEGLPVATIFRFALQRDGVL